MLGLRRTGVVEEQFLGECTPGQQVPRARLHRAWDARPLHPAQMRPSQEECVR